MTANTLATIHLALHPLAICCRYLASDKN